MSTPDKPDGSSMSGQPEEPLAHLLEVLALSHVARDDGRQNDDDVFVGASLHQPTGRVYGGQVLAQSLLAAGHTVEDDRLPHSLHGYFLRAGDVDAPITFGVERLRDGRSFSARRTHAYQDGRPILSMISSFQIAQSGMEITSPMPQVPGPDEVPSVLDTLGPIDHPVAQFWSRQSAFDLRHIEGSIYLGAGPGREPHQAVWMRARGRVEGGQLLQRAMLAYACDQIMLEPVLRGLGESWSTPGLNLASLDHAMWWHRDVQVDEWLLYTQRGITAQGGRGLGAAQIFAQDGTHVASVGQEGMVRVPREIEA